MYQSRPKAPPSHEERDLMKVSSLVFVQVNQIAGIRTCILATLAIHEHALHMDYVTPSEK